MTYLQKQYSLAKKEGRLCSQCGWIITKKNWEHRYKLCWYCFDANKGVNVSKGCYAPKDDARDMTGDS